MNRDDAVTAVAETLAADCPGCARTEQPYVVGHFAEARTAVAALEPYIAARIAAETEALRRTYNGGASKAVYEGLLAETEALRRDVERLTEARDSAWQHYDEQVADNADLTAERDEARQIARDMIDQRDEARAALAAETDALRREVEDQRAEVEHLRGLGRESDAWREMRRQRDEARAALAALRASKDDVDTLRAAAEATPEATHSTVLRRRLLRVLDAVDRAITGEA